MLRIVVLPLTLHLRTLRVHWDIGKVRKFSPGKREGGGCDLFKEDMKACAKRRDEEGQMYGTTEIVGCATRAYRAAASLPTTMPEKNCVLAICTFCP